MKNFFILLALMAFTSVINAHDIHWITFVDTTSEPKRLTSSNKKTRQLLYSRWINVVNSALAPKGYNAKIYDYEGERTSPENCKDVIKNLACEPEDIIVFYYLGHGARSIDDKSRFPQMWLAQDDEEECISLEELHKELRKKGARLTISIAMCCNSYDEGLDTKEGMAFSVNRGHSSVQTNAVNNIQQLFLKNKGDIIVSSSDKGQPSWTTFYLNGTSKEYFSYNLIGIFDTEVKKEYAADWESILSEVQMKVDKETLADSRTSNIKRQTPIFDINIEEVAEPVQPPVPPIPTPDVLKTKNNLKGVIMNNVGKSLDFIINTNPTRTARERVAKELLATAFTNNADVKVLGQDVDVVIDKSMAKDYFGNLSFTIKQLPLKVVVVDCELNDAKKIKSLIVREVYKK